jgi:outer membrane protein TolC
MAHPVTHEKGEPSRAKWVRRAAADRNGHCPRRRRVPTAPQILFLVCGAWLACATLAAGQDSQATPDYSANPEWFPRIYKPYVKTAVPAVDLTNSATLQRAVVSGTLALSLEQLKTVVRENNLDVQIARNNMHYSQTDSLRAKGGGAPRGAPGVSIPSSLFAGAIGAGVGSTGGLGGFGSAGGITGGARQVSAFPRGSLDPSLLLGFSVDRTTSPLNTIRVSGLPETTTSSTALQARYSQAFTTGTSISVAFNNMRQSSTQRFLLYNPDFVSTFSFTVTHQLLAGGGAVNRRFIEVTKKQSEIAQQLLRSQLNTSLALAQNAYWDLVAAKENVRVAEQSLDVARQLHEDNKVRERFGKISSLEVVTAASEVAARQRDLINAQTTMQLREVDLKNIISKEIDASLGAARIETTSPLPEPRDADIPQAETALASAGRNRPEIRQGEMNLQVQDIAIKYTKNLLKPSLVLFGLYSSSGLYGNRTIENPDGSITVLPGGIFQAWRQVWRSDYPEYAFGFSLSINLRNRSPQADDYRAKLEQRQTETALQRTRNSIALEVRKSIVGLIQSKAQVEAARKAVALTRELAVAEETKLLEGVTTPYEVIRRQRDLRAAEVAEVQARTNYAKALVELGRATGSLDGAP